MAIGNKIDHIASQQMQTKKFFSYPPNIVTRKAKCLYSLFKLDYIRRLGQNYIGRFTGMFAETGGFVILLTAWGIIIGKKEIIILAIAYVIIVGGLGLIAYYHKADRIESSIGLERDPFAKEVYKKNIKNPERL